MMLYIWFWHGMLWTTLGCILIFTVKLYRQRRSMRGLPGPPYHPLLGHIPIAMKMAAALPRDVHPHHYWHWLHKTYNLGEFYYFDVWPIGPPTLIICDPEIADQLTVKPKCLDKHPMVRTYLRRFLGEENMAASNGAVWRRARTCYNPGFATGHLMGTISNIVQDVLVFRDVLGEIADSRSVVEMEDVSMKLSFDVIGRLVLDLSLDSQRSSDELVDAFRKQRLYLSSANTWSSPLAGFDPLLAFTIWKNNRVINRYLGRELDRRFKKAGSEKGTSILDKALQTYNEEIKATGADGRDTTKDVFMDAAFKKSAIDQIRTFVFAGHDTIATTISMIFYYLSTNPSVRSRVCKELDELFTPSITSTADKIRSDPYILNKMIYCNAVIKETLRIFPPANTVRTGDGGFFTDQKTGENWPLPKDWVVWPDAYVLGRDTKYFPNPTLFQPERFVPEETPYPEVKIPAGAWRPFERGPRNCIGSEFGVLEIKVVMALTLRDFDFEVAYPDDAEVVEGERCYQMLFGSAKPKGGVPGRVKRVDKTKVTK